MNKILFITSFPPNTKTAGQDYSRRLLLDLIDKGFEVAVIYAIYPGHIVELPESVTILTSFTPSYKKCMQNPLYHPFFTRRFDKKILKYIQSIASNYDILYFDFSQVHLYSLYIEHSNKILMCHDVIAQKFQRKGILHLPWIKRTEKRVLKSASKIVTFSEKDCNFIKKTYKLDSINVNFYLKNGNFKYIDTPLKNNYFCFYGAWNRPENSECLIWFLKNVYPHLQNNLMFFVIGGGMNKELQNKISEYNNVCYLGFVDDPIKEIAKTQALIAPLHKGAGVKVKVIDALSSGTPVIGTDIAFEGIVDNKNNQLFYLAHKSKEYIAILNNWVNKKIDYKQAAADEFFTKYNCNHFSDLIMDDKLF